MICEVLGYIKVASTIIVLATLQSSTQNFTLRLQAYLWFLR